MDKKRLLQEIITKLREDATNMLAAAKATHDEATHEDNKAENKYDTRALEASYLAEAQARQAEEAEANLAKFEALPSRDYGPGDAIGPGALVCIEMNGYADYYFCGPGAGGVVFEIDGKDCTIVTRDSPMGGRLFESKEGKSFEMNGKTAVIKSVV